MECYPKWYHKFSRQIPMKWWLIFAYASCVRNSLTSKAHNRCHKNTPLKELKKKLCMPIWLLLHFCNKIFYTYKKIILVHLHTFVKQIEKSTSTTCNSSGMSRNDVTLGILKSRQNNKTQQEFWFNSNFRQAQPIKIEKFCFWVHSILFICFKSMVNI